MPIVQLLGADPNSPEYTAGEIYKAVKTASEERTGFLLFPVCLGIANTGAGIP